MLYREVLVRNRVGFRSLVRPLIKLKFQNEMCIILYSTENQFDMFILSNLFCLIIYQYQRCNMSEDKIFPQCSNHKNKELLTWCLYCEHFEISEIFITNMQFKNFVNILPLIICCFVNWDWQRGMYFSHRWLRAVDTAIHQVVSGYNVTAVQC